MSKYSKELTREIKEIIKSSDLNCSIKEFQDKVYWYRISIHQKLSESFIEKFKDRVDWDYISEYQKLSESFIDKFQDKINWNWVSRNQKLSESFIEKFRDKVNWNRISIYQKLSKKFRDKYSIEVPNNCWLYKPFNFKKKQLIETGLYELSEDGKHFIGYKGIRSDNYSKFNFQYKYEVGNWYESHCDCNQNNNDSFGLSVWTLNKVSDYCDERIIKVLVPINSIGTIVHQGNKIRCFKLKVLEIVE